MLHDTPLRARHEAYARWLASMAPASGVSDRRPGAATGHRVASTIEAIPYGPHDEQRGASCELIATFGAVELEYAAIRRGAALLDSPHRGTLVVTGADRREFLNRMLTQELQDLASGIVKQSFWLNRKGRIDADLMATELGDRVVIDVDIHQAASTQRNLSEFVFAEDVQIDDASARFHHVAVHGRAAAAALANACGIAAFELEDLRSRVAVIDSAEVVIARRDQLGEVGYELIVPYDQATVVWERLRGDGLNPAIVAAEPSTAIANRARPIGWYAFNIARVEAGTPLFNIDFGTTNLPHETGVLSQRVSFTKGCYLGQEVVARMENLGRPKQILVGLRIEGEGLPVACAQIFERRDDGSMGDEVGVVTSSTLSPMLGAAPIAFGMIKTAKAAAGHQLLVNAEDRQAEAVVHSLRFWPAERSEPEPR